MLLIGIGLGLIVGAWGMHCLSKWLGCSGFGQELGDCLAGLSVSMCVMAGGAPLVQESSDVVTWCAPLFLIACAYGGPILALVVFGGMFVRLGVGRERRSGVILSTLISLGVFVWSFMWLLRVVVENVDP